VTIDVLKPDLAKYGTPRQVEYLDAVLKFGSATKAAHKMGVNRRTVDRALSALRRSAIEAGDIAALDDAPKVLLLDIETAPCLAYIWRMYDEVNNIDQIDQDWYLLSWAAKWLGSDETIVRSLRMYRGYKPGSEDDYKLLKEMRELLCRAEYVIAHNGDNFDIKKLNTRMVMHGMAPPTPYRSIDTRKIAKRAFGFTSNKLDFLAQVLLGERKEKHDGLPLWKGTLRGDKRSWDTMERYNQKDVDLLERVYLKLRAWDHMHPNMNLTTNHDNMACSVCTSDNVKPTGDVVSVGQAGLYLGYVCGDCGHQMRGKTNIRTLNQKHAGLVNAK
jgi:RNase P subunit RPR2